VDEALQLVKEFATAKFNETVDASVNLGIDASKSDQQVRGSTLCKWYRQDRCVFAVFTSARTRSWPRPLALTSSVSKTGGTGEAGQIILIA